MSADLDRVRGLDGLRAIAALAIFFHHVGFWSGKTFDGDVGRFLGRLDIGVPVFFALSGFLLFRPIAVSVIDGQSLRPALVHLWRRAMRIYPAFWVALFLIVLLTSEGFNDLTGGIVTALLVHIHWPTYVIGPIPQAWSLATEITFYASLPLAARFLRPWLRDRDRAGRRNGLLVFTALCYLVSVAFRVWVLGLGNRYTGAAVLWLPAMLDYFAIGMTMAIAQVGFEPGGTVRSRIERLATRAGAWWVLAAVLFYVVSQRMGLALGLDSASWPREIGRQFMYGAIGFCLLFPLVFGGDHRSAVRSFVRSRPMEWLGTISYSIYVWHMVFIVHPWGPLVDMFGEVRPLDTPYWTLFVIAAIPAFAVSVASYYLVERTGQRLQGIVRRPTVNPTPSESVVVRAAAVWRAASLRAQLTLVAMVGLVFRFGYVIAAKRDQTLSTIDVFPGDQFFYSRAADALAAGDGFVTPWQDISIAAETIAPGTPAAHAADHPPLTAIVASPASWLPGGRGEHIFEQRFIMCFVGAAMIVMIGLLGREVAGRSVGLTAAVIAAAYPAFWINDGLVMAETLTTLMVTGALWAAFRYLRAPALSTMIELGAWIGLAALARAESLLLIPLLVLPIAWAAHRSDRGPHGIRLRLSRAIAAGVMTALVIAPWVIPNLVRFDEPVLMSTNDGLTLIGANSPQTYSGDAIGFWSLEYQQSIAADIPELAGADASAESRIWRNEAFAYIGDHLRDQPRVMAARLGRVWSVYRPGQMAVWNTGEGREIWASHLALVGYAAVLPLGLLGWWRLGRTGNRRWPLTAMAVHVSLIGALFYGIPRFRVPADVALVVCAAVAVHWLSNLGSCRHKPTSS